jgi:Pregnancy-associated plasma protein-A/Secretion system C-terminal sorting domain
MKLLSIVIIASCFITGAVHGQQSCGTTEYFNRESQKDPSLANRITAAENFIKNNPQNNNASAQRTGGERTVIKIPVVVHILYHFPGENISDEIVRNQIAILNRDFRRRNADTVNTPVHFKSAAADCDIEFKLAISDPRGRSTTGIIHKYTPIKKWYDDDKIKFAAEMGDDAWDSKSYLNIWVGNLQYLRGYSSVPGSNANIDGIVLAVANFGTTSLTTAPYAGRTAVHEAGHWLGLKHIWGDADCGDDEVSDTPKQRAATPGCPTGARVTCSNGPYGDMYMNYMDYTDDACINMFTYGQGERMRSLFAPGAVRNSILTSKGLTIPLIQESPLPEAGPKWLEVKVYPNPAADQLSINLEYDTRWIGQKMSVVNINGQQLIQTTITSKIQSINVSQLKPGIYFIRADKGDERIMQKFVKM